MTVIAFSKSIGPVPISVFVSEKHNTRLGITEIPVETGAKITDHAAVLPKIVTLDIAGAAATATYNALVEFQERREPFTLVTGLRVYSNMLISDIMVDRDATFGFVLRGRVECREIIIVDTAYAADPTGENSKAGAAGGKKSTNAARPTANNTGSPSAAAGSSSASISDRAAGPMQFGDGAASEFKDTTILQNIVRGIPGSR
ncbi:MAG: phage baseplate protein [Martelella sp.]|uniref:phage baseplate protein n=1 Tax=Martelella sp. TaxID=1969699 RepID=UPI003242EDE0